MIHAELLAIIDKHIYGRCFEGCLEHMPWRSLRAVVELHKPIHNPNFTDSKYSTDSKFWCWQCAEGRGYANYPCPTIQAIEKALN